MAFHLAAEQSGADTMTLPRDTDIPLALLGRSIAGLAEALRVHLNNDTARSAAERVAHIAGELSVAGQSFTHSPDRPSVAFPRAVVRRMARYLDTTGDLLDNGAIAADLDADKLRHLAAASHDNADQLRSCIPRPTTAQIAQGDAGLAVELLFGVAAAQG